VGISPRSAASSPDRRSPARRGPLRGTTRGDMRVPWCEPQRIMLAIAFASPRRNGPDAVAAAVHGGDHFYIPTAARLSSKPSKRCSVTRWTGARISSPRRSCAEQSRHRARGARLEVPFAKPVFYKGSLFIAVACGLRERREPFTLPAWTIQRRRGPGLLGRSVPNSAPDNCAERPCTSRQAVTFSHRSIGCLPAQHPCAQLHGHNYRSRGVLQSTHTIQSACPR